MSYLRTTMMKILTGIAEPRNFRRHVFLVLGIALFVRFAVLAFFWSRWDWHDGLVADQWNDLAINLVDNHTFGFKPYQPTVMRGPTFPWMEIPLYLAFGKNYAGWSISLLLLDTFTCFLLIVTTRKRWGNRTALLAGLFYSVNLPIIYYTAKISQVTSVLPLVVIYLYLFSLWEDNYASKWLPLALGLLSGAMILDKTVYLPVPFLFSAVLLWFNRKQGLKVNRLIPVLLYLVVTVAVVVPWSIRNYVVTKGAIIPVQNLFGEAFVQDKYYHDLGAATGGDRPEGELLKYFLSEQDKLLAENGVDPVGPRDSSRPQWEVQRENVFRKTGMRWVREDPVTILKIKVANLWNYWIRAENTRKTLLFALMQIVYLGSAVTGLILVWRFHQLARIKYGLALILVLWAEHCPVFAWGRYSLDLVPVLGLMFGLGIDLWVRHAQPMVNSP